MRLPFLSLTSAKLTFARQASLQSPSLPFYLLFCCLIYYVVDRNYVDWFGVEGRLTRIQNTNLVFIRSMSALRSMKDHVA
jgi:hypothetical protein